jgi:hypothetical protein
VDTGWVDLRQSKARAGCCSYTINLSCIAQVGSTCHIKQQMALQQSTVTYNGTKGNVIQYGTMGDSSLFGNTVVRAVMWCKDDAGQCHITHRDWCRGV